MKVWSWCVIVCAQLCIGCIIRAQATFELRNIGPEVNAPIFDSSGIPLSGTGYRVELYGGPAPSSLEPAFILPPFGGNRSIVSFMSGGNAGYFYPEEPGRSVGIPGTLGGGFAYLQVRAWNAELGATYEEVFALGSGGYGGSNVFYAQGGDPAAGPPAVPPEPLIGLESFRLLPVIPEPNATWLLLVGISALFMAKWRRSRR